MWREKTGFFLGRVVWSGSFFFFLLPFLNFFDEMPSVWLSCRLCSDCSAAHRGKWEKEKKRDENIFPGSFFEPLSFPFFLSPSFSHVSSDFSSLTIPFFQLVFLLVFSLLLYPDRSPHRQRVEKRTQDTKKTDWMNGIVKEEKSNETWEKEGDKKWERKWFEKGTWENVLVSLFLWWWWLSLMWTVFFLSILYPRGYGAQ